jgi:SAM-dependent methyltransferase
MRSIYRELLDQELECLQIPYSSSVLDLGGKITGNRSCCDLRSKVKHHVVLNLDKAVDPDIVGTAESLPFKSDSFNFVICIDVLEYISSVDQALREIHRVLQPNGILIATWPFLVPQHGEVGDRVRITYSCFLDVLKSTGFGDTNLKSVGGVWSVVFDIILHFTKNQLDRLILAKLVIKILSWSKPWVMRFDVNSSCIYLSTFSISRK